MKLHECLDELRDRAASGNGDHVPLMTRDVIELIEDRNALYEALEAAVDAMDAAGMTCYDERDALAKARGEA